MSATRLSPNKSILSFLFLCCSALLFSAATKAEKIRMYRWTDSSGKTHYSDKIPPEYKNYQREELNKDGMSIALTTAAKTERQKEIERQLNQFRETALAMITEQRHQDELLLKSFRTEKEIQQSKLGKLDMANFQIKIASANQERLGLQLKSLIHKAAQFEKKGGLPPKSLEDKIKSTQSQINAVEGQLEELTAEKKKLTHEFDEKLIRFKALKAQQERGADYNPTQNSDSYNYGNELSFIRCPSANCGDQLRTKARRYISSHSSRPLQIDTAVLMTTALPIRLQDISLIAAQLTDSNGDQILFIDAICHHSDIGLSQCHSEKTAKVLREFTSLNEAD